jgi:hypothetical protein
MPAIAAHPTLCLWDSLRDIEAGSRGKGCGLTRGRAWLSGSKQMRALYDSGDASMSSSRKTLSVSRPRPSQGISHEDEDAFVNSASRLARAARKISFSWRGVPWTVRLALARRLFARGYSVAHGSRRARLGRNSRTFLRSSGSDHPQMAHRMLSGR